MRRVIAGNTAQNPSQYRHELQIVNMREASASGADIMLSNSVTLLLRRSTNSCERICEFIVMSSLFWFLFNRIENPIKLI
jgi:hypothetical protein